VTDAMISEPKTPRASVSVRDIRRFLEDDHVHSALLVRGRRLLAFVERSDVPPPGIFQRLR
jgi:hypothetical protein